MNYLEILKSVSYAFIEHTDLSLNKEILFSNSSTLIYLNLPDIPEILCDKTFYNIQNLISILSEKYDDVTDKVIDDNNGKLIFSFKNGAKIEILYSRILSQRNKKQKSILEFLNVTSKHDNFYEFDISGEDLKDMKKYQTMFKTKTVSLIGEKENIYFLIINADEDKYNKNVALTSSGDFKCNFRLTDLPNSPMKIKVVKHYNDKTQSHHYVLISSNDYVRINQPIVLDI